MSDKNNVVSLGDHAGNALMITPAQILQDCLDNDIGKRGAFKNGKKLLILVLDDTEGNYHTNFCQAGMKYSEMVSLLTVMQSYITKEMGF
ncbi:MAG: hypothetical protein P9L97_06235 [Candidatus Tenebribacter davisii]|nr:hypothetical protein [Candidatus Tenebribacter davisii]